MDEPRTTSGRAFSEELGAFLDCVGAGLADAGLEWNEVVIAERDESTWTSAPTTGPDAAPYRGPVHTPQRFARRFAEILDQVARDWVNLTVDTIDQGRLVVTVEWCSAPALRDRTPPRRPISVNWSGMSSGEMARLTSR